MLYFIMFTLGFVLACVIIYTLSRQIQVKEIDKNQKKILWFSVQSLENQKRMNEILSNIHETLREV